MRTEQVSYTAYRTEYITNDGKRYTSKSEAEHHEAMLNGNRRACSDCRGTGNMGEEQRTSYQAGYGVEHYSVTIKCKTCNGKGYLEKTVSWS